MSRAGPSAGVSKARRRDAKALYPSFLSWLASFAAHMFRGPALAALFAFAIYGPLQQLYDLVQLSDDQFFVLVTCLLHSGLYLAMNGFLGYCDYAGWLQQHKLPRTKRMQPSRELIRSTLIDTVVNQFVVYPGVAYLAAVYLVQLPNPHAPLASSFLEVWRHFALCEITNEIGFYAVHRLVHESTFLYRTVHKKHHNYVGTIGIAAEHAAPLEGIFANTLPTVIYCLYFRVHIAIWITWLGWRLWETYESHSGYCFDKTWLAKLGLLHADRTRFHDFHHTQNVGNFGTKLGLDYWLGTMDEYLLSLEDAVTTDADSKQK